MRSIVGGPVGRIAGIGIGAGVAAAKVIVPGISDEWVARFRHAVRPDTATGFVLASSIDQGAYGAKVDRLPNVQLVRTTIRIDAYSQLRSAFDDRAPKGRVNDG